MNTAIQDTTTVADLCLLRLPEVQRRCGLSRSTIYDLIARGEFPPQVRLGTNSVAFSSAEIDEWIASRIAARDAKVVAA